jgi:hypothetical protein
MNKSTGNKGKRETHPERRLETDLRTSLPILTGSPPITKEKIKRDYPVDCCRDATIIRRSVGLGKKDPFEDGELSTVRLDNKEEVAANFPRDCCRFTKFLRRSVGFTKDEQTGDPNKCCFTE